MEKDISKLARSVLGEDGAKAIGANSTELQRLADSKDGQKVKAMLEGSGALDSAINSGDTEALKTALGGILKTKEGQRLAQQLSALIQGKQA